MNKEATKYCEECKNCLLIEIKMDTYWIHCKYRAHIFDDEVIYCKYKKIKKKGEEKCLIQKELENLHT